MFNPNERASQPKRAGVCFRFMLALINVLVLFCYSFRSAKWLILLVMANI